MLPTQIKMNTDVPLPTDPLRSPQQILLLRATLLPHVDILVHPRSINSRLRSQHADVLVADATTLQTPSIQRDILRRRPLTLEIRPDRNDIHWCWRLKDGHHVEDPGEFLGVGE